MSNTLYSQTGEAIAYIDDTQHIWTYGGMPAAYLIDDSIFSYSGTHLGWFENGLVRDHHGRVVLFAEGAQGGPIKPIRQIKPLKGIKQIKPIKGIRQIKPLKPIKSLSWSQFDPSAFFLDH